MISKFSDVPVEKLIEDQLGFGDYAKGIITTIESVSEQDTPFTVAIFGPWGSGKTSLMKITRDLLNSKNYETVFFNSWEYGNEERPWIPFMIQVVKELFKDETDREELIKNIFLFSTDIVLQYYSNGKLSTGSIRDLIWRSKKTAPFKEWSDEDVKIVIERVTKIKEFRDEIEKRAQKSPNKKIIIFIDDLDRIPEKLIGFLNSLKTFFDINGCIFILGCDYKILDKELKKMYAGENTEEIYENYFDKIVQTEFYIPKISEQAIDGYLRFLTGWSEDEVKECRLLVVNSIGGNPRKIKRAVNATVLIRNIFGSKLATLLQEFEQPKKRKKRGVIGEETTEEPAALAVKIIMVFTPAKEVFDILFDKIMLFKLVCMREQWHGLYESILSEEETQKDIISFQEANSNSDVTKLIRLIKENEEKHKETKRNLPIFLKERPCFQGVDDIKTYLTLLEISSPEAGISLKYVKPPEELSDNLFNRYMLFERINKGNVDEKIIEKKINNMDWKSNLYSIDFFIEVIRAFKYYDLIRHLFENEENTRNITEKIKGSKDPEAIGGLLESIKWVNEEIARRLLTETKDTYAEKIKERRDPEAIGYLLESVEEIDKEVAIGLLTETKGAYEPLNKKIDYTNVMSPVKNSGVEGSTVGFAVADVLEYQIFKKWKKRVILSPRYLYYYAKVQAGVDPHIDSGAIISDAIKVISTEGAVKESVWPYISGDLKSDPPAAVKEAEHYKISQSHFLNTLEEIKAALQTYGPIVAGIEVFESFSSSETFKTGKIPLPTASERVIGGHAICIVGYDDEKRVLKFKNQWTSEWGENGYGYITYIYAKRFIADAWAISM